MGERARTSPCESARIAGEAMKAILLSAGQGRRLLPLTRAVPKCLLTVCAGQSVLEAQLRALEACGIRRATVLVGFGAERVERALEMRSASVLEARAAYNPFYAVADNLVTAWLAQSAMDEDFVLINGDTLFDPRLLERLLSDAREPAAIAVARKPAYDDDDMKVILGYGDRLLEIGKKLDGRRPDGEAIGMSVFRGDGVASFRESLDRMVRATDAHGAWYTSALADLAQRTRVQTIPVQGLWWTEIDSPADLDVARWALRQRAATGPGPAPQLVAATRGA